MTVNRRFNYHGENWKPNQTKVGLEEDQEKKLVLSLVFFIVFQHSLSMMKRQSNRTREN